MLSFVYCLNLLHLQKKSVLSRGRYLQGYQKGMSDKMHKGGKLYGDGQKLDFW